MATGKVKWFNNQKKYGFIIVDGKEVFVHFSAILKDGYKTLKKGQEVECDVIPSPNGDRAVNVKEILPASNPSRRETPKRSHFSETAFEAQHLDTPLNGK